MITTTKICFVLALGIHDVAAVGPKASKGTPWWKRMFNMGAKKKDDAKKKDGEEEGKKSNGSSGWPNMTFPKFSYWNPIAKGYRKVMKNFGRKTDEEKQKEQDDIRNHFIDNPIIHKNYAVPPAPAPETNTKDPICEDSTTADDEAEQLPIVKPKPKPVQRPSPQLGRTGNMADLKLKNEQKRKAGMKAVNAVTAGYVSTPDQRKDNIKKLQGIYDLYYGLYENSDADADFVQLNESFVNYESAIRISKRLGTLAYDDDTAFQEAKVKLGKLVGDEQKRLARVSRINKGQM